MNGRAAGLVSVVSGISKQSEVGYPDTTAGMDLNLDSAPAAFGPGKLRFAIWLAIHRMTIISE